MCRPGYEKEIIEHKAFASVVCASVFKYPRNYAALLNKRSRKKRDLGARSFKKYRAATQWKLFCLSNRPDRNACWRSRGSGPVLQPWRLGQLLPREHHRCGIKAF